MPQLPAGIGRYQIIKKIEEGNYATVYKVSLQNREYILKIARKNLPEFNDLIKREFQILAQFTHPNIVPTHEYNTAPDGRAYFVLDYIKGKPINQFFHGLSDELIEALIQVINGLGAFHNKGFVHSDLKPEHIIYNPEAKKIVLIDFGFAGITTRQIKKYGTVGYVAPEVLKGIGIDQRSDLYSLGVIIYEILSGTNLKLPLRPIQNIPEQLNNVILRLLSEEPCLRPTVPELYEVFTDLLPKRKFVIPPYEVSLPPTIFVEIPEIMERLLRLKGEAVIINGETGSGKSRLLKELKYKYLFQDYEVFSYTGREEGYLHEFICRSINFKDLKFADKEDQFQIFAEITEHLLEYARNRRVVLLIDDLDELSDYELGLMRFIGHSLEETNITLIGTATSELRVKDLNFFQLNLRPFSRNEVQLLIERTFFEIKPRDGQDLTSFIDWLYQHTGGNPLFIVETLKELHNQRILRYYINHWEIDIETLHRAGIPENVAGLLSRRLQRLSGNALAILKILMIADFPLDLSVLWQILPEMEIADFEFLHMQGMIKEERRGEKRYFTVANQYLKSLIEKEISEEEVVFLSRKIIEVIEKTIPAEVFYPLLARLYKKIGCPKKAFYYSYNAGVVAEEVNDRKGAIKFYTSALESVYNLDSEDAASVFLRLGGLYLLDGENHRAIECYNKTIGLEKFKVAGLFGLGKAYSNLGDYGQAIEYLKSASATASEEKNKVEILNRLAYCYICLKDFAQGKKILKEAEELSRKIEAPELEAEVLYYLATLEWFRGNHTDGLQIGRKLLEFCDKKGMIKQLAYAANLLSSFFIQTGDIESGLKYIDIAIENFEKIKYLNALGAAMINKGLLIFNTGEIIQARDIFIQTLNISQKIKNWLYELIIYNCLANIYEITGKLKNALDYYKRAKDIDPDSAYANYGMAMIYYKTGEIDRAKGILEESLKKKHEVLYLIGLGLIFLVLGKKELAEEYIERGIAIMEKEGAEISIKREVYLKSSQAYYEIGDFKKGLSFARQLKDIAIKGSREYWLGDGLIKINEFRLKMIGELDIEENLTYLKEKELLYDYAYLKRLKIESIIDRGIAQEMIKGIAEELESVARIFHALGGTLELNRVEKLKLSFYPLMVRDYSRRVISAQYLETFSKLAELISSRLGDEDFIVNILDLVIEATRAERGAVFIKTEKGMEFVAGRNIDRKTIKDAGELSRTAIAEINKNRIVFVPNALDDPRFNIRKSVLLNQIRSILCIPLVVGANVIGAIYLDSRMIGSIFNEQDRDFLITIARILASVIEKSIAFRNLSEENILLKTKVISDLGAGYLLSKSTKMRRIYKTVEAIANSDAPVLIYGETGTGKGMLARLIHLRSRRRDKKFLSINCGAIPETLLESELFGHKKGAFTGAIADKKGLLEEAEGGTVFLDEISNTTPGFQAKMLEAIEDKIIRRVGETTTKRIDVRFILASNRDLEIEVEEGRFRQDLYFRINVFKITVPPLRERVVDIPQLARFFLERYAKEMGKPIRGFAPGVMERLKTYHWPGNIRELMNVIERAVTLCNGDLITMEDIGLAAPKKGIIPLEELEKEAVLEALNATGWNRTRAAKKLGIDRRTLYNYIKKYSLSP
ncbi:MAG: sigma 54-interacting transcriptional regulator [candidate division WOR-3 bacterium]